MKLQIYIARIEVKNSYSFHMLSTTQDIHDKKIVAWCDANWESTAARCAYALSAYEFMCYYLREHRDTTIESDISFIDGEELLQIPGAISIDDSILLTPQPQPK